MARGNDEEEQIRSKYEIESTTPITNTRKLQCGSSAEEIPTLSTNHDHDRRIMQTMLRSGKGVTLVEYALPLAMLTIAVAVSTPKISSAVTRIFVRSASILDESPTPPPAKP